MEGLMCRQIVASVAEEASGPSYSVTALSDALRVQGVDCSVMAVGTCSDRAGLELFPQNLTHVPVANRLLASGELARAIKAAARQRAVLHSHGLWLMPNIYPARAARSHNVPLVVSPRGMLGQAALSFSAVRKRIAWSLMQRSALETVNCFHATSEAELEDIRRAGLKAPIAVIPNGVHIPDGDPIPAARTILHLGRLHPKKGIDRLVTAWSKIAAQFPDWWLRIVGPSELGCRAALERQIERLGAPRVILDGPLYGADKWNAYREAGLFVLPTLDENFGMVVAEALAAGVPVVCTKGAPWKGLAIEQCGWWIDHGSDAMETALETALLSSDGARTQMGVNGRAWMRRDFGWEGIALRMAEVYAWLLGHGEKPDCVRL